MARAGVGSAPLGVWVANALAGAVGEAPALALFAATLAPLVSGEHALCALPFALTVR